MRGLQTNAKIRTNKLSAGANGLDLYAGKVLEVDLDRCLLCKLVVYPGDHDTGNVAVNETPNRTDKCADD